MQKVDGSVIEKQVAAFAVGLQHLAASENIVHWLLEHDVTLALAIKPLLPLLAQKDEGLEIVEHAEGSNGGGTHVCSSLGGHAIPPPEAALVTLAKRSFVLVVGSQAPQADHVYTQFTRQQVSCSGAGHALPPFAAGAVELEIF